jgi:hypothetical protein
MPNLTNNNMTDEELMQEMHNNFGELAQYTDSLINKLFVRDLLLGISLLVNLYVLLF